MSTEAKVIIIAILALAVTIISIGYFTKEREKFMVKEGYRYVPMKEGHWIKEESE